MLSVEWMQGARRNTTYCTGEEGGRGKTLEEVERKSRLIRAHLGRAANAMAV